MHSEYLLAVGYFFVQFFASLSENNIPDSDFWLCQYFISVFCILFGKEQQLC